MNTHWNRTIDWLDWTLGFWTELQTWLAVAGLVGMISINILEIISRFVFRYSFVWVQEATLLLACWSIFLGFSVITYKKKDIAVHILVQYLPASLKRAVLALTAVINVLFLAVLAYSAMRLLTLQAEQVTLVIGFPVTLYNYPLIIAALSAMLANLLDVFRGVFQTI